MRQPKTGVGIILLLLVILAMGLVTQGMFMPLVAVMQNLTSGSGKAPVPGSIPLFARVVSNPIFAFLPLVLAACSLAVDILGVKRDEKSRSIWIVLLVISSLTLLSAVVLAVAASGFSVLMKDLVHP